MKIWKYILYIAFIGMLWIPLAQMRFHFVEEGSLGGAYTPNEKLEFNAQNWFDGSFQTNYEKYLNDTLGFHKTMVLERNRFYYNVFHQASGKGVVIGKDDILFEEDYLKTRNGDDYLGYAKIDNITKEIKHLQDKLKKQGKTLVICLAPNKADFFAEYIPRRYQQPETDSTNQKQFSKMLTAAGVNVIDFNKWFLAQKKTAEYPLYPPYGIHWSEYGMLLASDSIISYIEKLRSTTLPHIIIDDYECSSEPRSGDFDIGHAINLPEGTLRSCNLCYPKWHWSFDNSGKRLHMICIADSYYWQIFNIGMQNYCFDGQFWYYNNTIYPDSYTKEITTKEINVRKSIKNTDIVMIVITSMNLKEFGWGLLEELRMEN